MTDPTLTILVIDDEKDVHLIIEEALRPHGYTVHAAMNGAQGLEMAKLLKPNAVLLDIMMPAIDGFKVQELLKEDAATKDIPIIFVTAKTTLEDTIRALSHGAVGYIEKPFDSRRLVSKINALFNRQS